MKTCANPLFKNARWVVLFNSQKFLENSDKNNPYNWELAIEIELLPAADSLKNLIMDIKYWELKYILYSCSSEIVEKIIKPIKVYYNTARRRLKLVFHDTTDVSMDWYLSFARSDIFEECIESTEHENIENYEKLYEVINDDKERVCQ